MRIGLITIVVLAVIIGGWSLASLIGGVIAAGGVGNLILGWMTAVGLVTPVYTLGGYYTQIKGVEYIICLIFFVLFPLFVYYIGHGENHHQKRIQSV